MIQCITPSCSTNKDGYGYTQRFILTTIISVLNIIPIYMKTMSMLEVPYIKSSTICALSNHMRFKLDEKMTKNACNSFDFLIKRSKFCIPWKSTHKNMDKLELCLFENLIRTKVAHFTFISNATFPTEPRKNTSNVF